MRTMLLLIMAIVAGSAAADVVTMKDGRRFEGVIIEDRAGVVVIDCTIANIRTKLSLDRAEIASIELGPVAPVVQQPKPERPQVEIDPPDRFLWIPVHGVFISEQGIHDLEKPEGVYFDEAPIREILEWSRRKGLETLVFHFDTAGGDPEVAASISRLLSEYDETFRYVMVLGRASGSAARLLLHADELYVQNAATLTCAEADHGLSWIASSKGVWPVPVADAMVRPSSEAHWRKTDDGIEFSADGGAGWTQLDGRTTMLSIARDELVMLGLAGVWSESAYAGDAWSQLGRYGETPLQKRSEALIEAHVDHRKLHAWIESIPALVGDARSRWPAAAYDDYEYERVRRLVGGKFMYVNELTRGSRQLWDRREATYISGWRNVRRECDDFLRTARKYDDAWIEAALPEIRAYRSEARAKY